MAGKLRRSQQANHGEWSQEIFKALFGAVRRFQSAGKTPGNFAQAIMFKSHPFNLLFFLRAGRLVLPHVSSSWVYRRPPELSVYRSHKFLRRSGPIASLVDALVCEERTDQTVRERIRLLGRFTN